MLHRELNVARKADGQVYVPITIGEYIITFTCFLHCAKKVVLFEISKVRLVESLKWQKGRKIGGEKISKVVENERINVSVSPYRPLGFLEKRTSIFFKQLWQMFFAMTWLAAL